MTSNEIREAFLSYFERNGHRRVPSSPVISQDDPTLLFTNAGMNQFKDVFLGRESREYVRATSAQKCIRVSGKHNDLEEVGRDTYHHTFFEMLGNWSFGDYYKKGAIDLAWEFLTKELGLPKEKLWATVFYQDDEAESLWKEVTGMPAERIGRFDEKENFWEMGEIGPCGPCSEIHFDLGLSGCGRPDCGPNCPHCDRFVELWNLVFIQYNRDDEGKLCELPAKHVDTGLGLERLVAILQGTSSNYQTDLFLPIIAEIEEITGEDYGDSSKQVSFRVIADHIRALSFAITDGATPSNEGRGYVLRRILRRAARFGRNLGMHEPFIYKLAPKVVDIMGQAYPELRERCQYVSLVVKGEEESFGKTLDRGIEIFEGIAGDLKRKGLRVIPGKDAFKLYDTYGFPLDLTQLMAEEKGLQVDLKGFELEMEAQRERAKMASKFKVEEGDWTILSAGDHSRFVGYDLDKAPVIIRRMRTTQQGIELILDQTPFYAEAGGQVGDVGKIWSDRIEIEVTDTTWSGDAIVHQGRLIKGELKGEVKGLVAEIDLWRRRSVARNHTATHLLHAALREILGSHVRQSGSLVAPDRLRFDFTHFSSISTRELDRVEQLVNEKIRENIQVSTSEKPIDEAKAMGALAFFGEKYGEAVRLVQIGDYSLELCGGTHVKATGEIGQFRLLSEAGISAGIRRIEALTGEGAESRARQERQILTEIAQVLNVPPLEAVERIQRLVAMNKELEKKLQRLSSRDIGSEIDDLVKRASLISGFKVVSARVEVEDMDALRRLADLLREKLRTGVGVLGTVFDQKASFLVVVTDDLIRTKGLKAGEIAKEIAEITGGGGGGRSHMAQAGGRNPDKLDQALGKVRDIVREQLKEERK